MIFHVTKHRRSPRRHSSTISWAVAWSVESGLTAYNSRFVSTTNTVRCLPSLGRELRGPIRPLGRLPCDTQAEAVIRMVALSQGQAAALPRRLRQSGCPIGRASFQGSHQIVGQYERSLHMDNLTLGKNLRQGCVKAHQPTPAICSATCPTPLPRPRVSIGTPRTQGVVQVADVHDATGIALVL